MRRRGDGAHAGASNALWQGCTAPPRRRGAQGRRGRVVPEARKAAGALTAPSGEGLSPVGYGKRRACRRGRLVAHALSRVRSRATPSPPQLWRTSMRRAVLAPFVSALAACSSGGSTSAIQYQRRHLEARVVAQRLRPPDVRATTSTSRSWRRSARPRSRLPSASRPASRPASRGSAAPRRPSTSSSPAPSLDAGADCATIAQKAPACDATVAAVDQCASDQIAALDAVAAEATMLCAEIGSNATPTTPATLPVSCTSLPAGCQSLFGSSSSSSSD